MFRTSIAAFLMATAVAFPSFAQDLKPIREVEVKVDTAGIANAQAAAYWGTLQDDLKAAILTKVAPSEDEAAYVIKIRIDDVSLANGFQEKLGLGDTTDRHTPTDITALGTNLVESCALGSVTFCKK